MWRVTYLGCVLAFICCGAISGQKVNVEDMCPDVKKADIVVAVDESGSVTQDGWDDQVNFLAKVSSNLPIGVEEVQVGLLQFSTNVSRIFNLNKYKTQKDLVKAMKELKYEQKGLTYTHDALREAMNMLTPEFGARKNTQKVIILLTDGASNKPNETLKAAKAVKAKKIEVLVVGVGDTREDELKAMASKPKFVLHTKNTTALLKDDFVKEKVIGSLRCITKCRKVQRADLVFMLDESTSIKRDGFEKEKEFMKVMIKDLKINKNSVHVGLVTFADTARSVFDLKDFKSKEQIKATLKDLTWEWGQTRTHKGLQMVQKDYFSSSGGMRKGVPHVLVVLSDGRSTDTKATIEEIKKIKAAGVLVVAIGVGKDVSDEELESMASEKRYIIRANTFDDLAVFNKITREIMNSVDCVVLTAES